MGQAKRRGSYEQRRSIGELMEVSRLVDMELAGRYPGTDLSLALAEAHRAADMLLPEEA